MSRRVVVDGKPLSGRPTGVGRALSGVLGALAEIDAGDLEVEVATPPARARTLPWVQLGLPRRARGAAVLHCPFYYRPVWAPCPTVVCVYDVLVLSHPEWFPWRGRVPFAQLVRSSVCRAAAVITASAEVLAEIEERIGPLDGRGTVVPLGVDARRFAPCGPAEIGRVRTRHDLRRPYLLHVGSLHRRRGLDVALAALAGLTGHWPDLELVAVGREERAWGEVPAALAGRVRLLGYVSDLELPALMSGAAALLALSRGEGFDLPLLEGLACGAAVVASDIAVHREHFAPWARLVRVGDAAATAAAIAEVLASPPGKVARAAQAQAVATRFKWAAAARAHLAVWRRVAGGAR